MTRLNKATRNAITENAIEKSGVVTREKTLIERRAQLAEDVRLFAIGGAEKEAEALAAFEKIKKYIAKNGHELVDAGVYLVGQSKAIHCNFAGRSIDLFFNGHKDRGNGRSVFKHLVASNYSNRVAITADNPLNDEFDAIEQEQKTIDELRLHVRSEVTAMVNSVTTIKKLIEIWPESKELLPPEEQVQSTALVANVDNLNAMIGLPTNE